METTDYKALYESIPKGYKKDVMKEAGCYKPDIHYWKKGEEKKVGVDKLERLEMAIDKHTEIHNLAKLITVKMMRNITVDETLKFSYADLMEFQIYNTGTIGSHGTKFELINSAREEYENLNSKNPYALKLLIAKKIIHDTNH